MLIVQSANSVVRVCLFLLWVLSKSAFAQKDTVIHLPYTIELPDSLCYIGKARVHKQCCDIVKKMIEDAKKEKVYLGIRSAYRDSAEQAYQFYYLGDLYKQTMKQRLKHTAPPKFSEHHTGFAIDFMDLQNTGNNYSISFEQTPAFKWLQKNACRYGFVMSFPKNNKQNIQYEPWHWRYEGNDYARSKFEQSYPYRYE